MTTKTLSTYAAAGYTLARKFDELIITATGGAGGTGVTARASATVDNSGRVNASGSSAGITLLAGGSVINERGGSIAGARGVVLSRRGTVTNDGSIGATAGAAIYLEGGGRLINGGYADRAASILGGVQIYRGHARVDNFGSIDGRDLTGVFLAPGGAVINGGAGDTTAAIVGRAGIATDGAATVANFGTIAGTAGVRYGDGARLDSGTLTNGTATDRAALIEGYTGVSFFALPGSVTNFGTILGEGVSTRECGVEIHAGGDVVNGGAGDADALIRGAVGVLLDEAGTVTNFGLIEGVAAEGVDLAAGGGLLNLGAIHGATFGVEVNGGIVTNGGGAVRSAVIAGYGTGVLGRGNVTVDNSGTIMATGRAGGVGVKLTAGGGMVNGSRGDGGALIGGDTGVSLTGSGAFVDNYGTILGLGDFSGFGVALHGGETASNVLASSRIEGSVGVAAYGGGNTVFNAGTIIGSGPWAARLTDATDALEVAAGAAFVGTVEGGGGTLDLTSGVGTLSGLLASHAVTVTGSMAATTFHDFDTLEVGGGTFRSSGDVTLTAGQAIIDEGSLTLGGGKAKVTNAGLIEAEGPGLLTIKGAIQNTGTLAVLLGTITVAGAVTGAGVAHIDSGRLDFMASFTEDVTFTGASQRPGILELAQSQSYSGTVTGFSKVGRTFLDLDDIAFGAGTTATYAGSKTGGTLTVTDGTHTAHIALLGDYRRSTFAVASDGHGGTKVNDPASFVAAMAGFGAGGAGPLEPRAPWAHAPPMLLASRTHLA